MVPRLSRVAVLVNPANASHSTILESVQAAAQKRRRKDPTCGGADAQEIDNAFSLMRQQNAGALMCR